jgi:hypothetical protein
MKARRFSMEVQEVLVFVLENKGQNAASMPYHFL